MNEFNGINNIADKRWGVLFNLGSLPVSIYGILFVLAFLISVVIASIKLRHFYKISYDPIFYFSIFVFPAGILGASIWSAAIGNSSHFYDGFTGRGGLAIQGGVVTGIILGLFWFPLITRKAKYWVKVPYGQYGQYEKLARVSSWIYFDTIIPVIILGQAIGRWGNFFNYEVFGEQVGNMSYQTALQHLQNNDLSAVPFSWLYSVMPGVWHNMWIAKGIVNTGTFLSPSADWSAAAHFHTPLFLYESFFNIIFFAIFYGVINFIPKYKAGIIGGLTMVYTGMFRTITENVRFEGFGFNQSFVFSILIALTGLIASLYAAFVAGNKKVRFISWFEYFAAFLKHYFYQLEFFRSIAKKYAELQDQIFKTELTNKVYLDIKKFLNKVPRLTDYVIGEDKQKYFGANFVKIYYLTKNKNTNKLQWQKKDYLLSA